VTSRFDCVFWLGDLNSRMQKDRNQLETMLRGKSSEQPHNLRFDDIVQHDELKQVIDEGLATLPFSKCHNEKCY